MLLTIVRHNQPVEILWTVPARLKSAIANLGQHRRGEFGERLAVVNAHGKPRRQAWPHSRARSEVLSRGQALKTDPLLES